MVNVSASARDTSTLSPLFCVHAALTYAQEGIPVFPVAGKIPFKGTRGFHDATCDPDRIVWWWRRWPDANVAVPTGSASGWAVLDIDGRHGGFTSFKRLRTMLEDGQHDTQYHPVFTKTRISRTGSGAHLIWKHEDGLRNATACAGFAGLDLRGEGGYIVVPPSRHPNGSRYRWEQEMVPAPFPPRLLTLLRQKQPHQMSLCPQPAPVCPRRSSLDPEYWLERAVAHACVGKRHACALWLACRLIQHAHLTLHQAQYYLNRYVEQVPGGGDDYPLSDALNCLQWASTHL